MSVPSAGGSVFARRVSLASGRDMQRCSQSLGWAIFFLSAPLWKARCRFSFHDGLLLYLGLLMSNRSLIHCEFVKDKECICSALRHLSASSGSPFAYLASGWWLYSAGRPARLSATQLPHYILLGHLPNTNSVPQQAPDSHRWQEGSPSHLSDSADQFVRDTNSVPTRLVVLDGP